MLGEYENLDKLNYLAALLDEPSLSDPEQLAAIMEAGCDAVSDIDDLINLTFNLDCYDIMPGINDESDLGYYYVHAPLRSGVSSGRGVLGFSSPAGLCPGDCFMPFRVFAKARA